MRYAMSRSGRNPRRPWERRLVSARPHGHAAIPAEVHMSRTNCLSGLLFGLVAGLLAAQASAQTPEPGFPTRAIKIISASPAGTSANCSAAVKMLG